MVTPTEPAVKRPYRSALREEQARRTRRAIVSAASALFVENGYVATTVDAIAERAGVSRKTVFTSVGGKPEALKLAIDWANVGDDEPVPMLERPHVQEGMREPDARRVLALFARDHVQIADRNFELYQVLRQAVGADPQLRDLAGDLDDQRLLGMMALAEQLHRRDSLRRDLTVATAAEVLSALTSEGSYGWLVRRQGWGPDRFQTWFADLLVHAIIDPAYRPPRRRRTSD
jgi:AcrR family transcriptional regulator